MQKRPSWKWVGACALMCVAWGASASTAWVWLDETGRQVYSDLPPPPSVPNSRIVRQPSPPPNPRVMMPEPAQAAGAAGAAAGDAAGKPAPGNVVLVENEEQLRAMEKQNAQIRASNCRQAQQALSVLQRPGRLATLNEQGQRVNMTESMRKAETSRAQTLVKENCE